MSKREAIRILMLSPIYFRLSLLSRRELIRDFLVRHGRGGHAQEGEKGFPWPFSTKEAAE
ncbi:hypothetical protein ACUUL3_13985 [Thiovibrio sp. JS02]